MPFFLSTKKLTKIIDVALQPYVNKALQPIITSLNNYAYKIGGYIYPSWESYDNIQNLICNYDLFAVVDKIAVAVSGVDLEVYKKTPDRKALKSYKRYSPSDIRKKLFKRKALTEVAESDTLKKLLDDPCPGFSQQQFFKLVSMLYLTCGEVYIWKERTLNNKVIALHIFSGPDVAINVTGDFPYRIASYNFYIGGAEVMKNVPAKDVISIIDPSPVYDKNGSHLRGFSKLKPGKKLLNRLNASDARTDATLKNGTVPGIIFVKESDSAPEYSKFRTSYQKFIENDDNAGAAYPMAGDVGYIQTGLKLADMQLMEGQKMTFDKLCNLYHVWKGLFNNNDASTESNVKEQRKDFYTSAAIPCADAIQDSFNRQLCPDFGFDYEVDFDFSEIPELQIDLLATMNAIAAMPISLTGNEIRDIMNYEDSLAENMDIPMLKQGYSPIDNLDILPAPGAGLP